MDPTTPEAHTPPVSVKRPNGVADGHITMDQFLKFVGLPLLVIAALVVGLLTLGNLN